MLVKPELIEKIAKGEKTQTRRLVKLKDIFQIGGAVKVWDEEPGKIKTKWQIGKDYAVQSGRGKKGVYFCSKCKAIDVIEPHCFTGILRDEDAKICFRCGIGKTGRYLGFPLRIRITKIEKQKLHEISIQEATKEGFEPKDEKRIDLDTKETMSRYLSARWMFLFYFAKLNLKHQWSIGDNNKTIFDTTETIHKVGYGKKEPKLWNPDVWVLSFEVVKHA